MFNSPNLQLPEFLVPFTKGAMPPKLYRYDVTAEVAAIYTDKNEPWAVHEFVDDVSVTVVACDPDGAVSAFYAALEWDLRGIEDEKSYDVRHIISISRWSW